TRPLGRTLNVQRVRLACGCRAPPCSWTLLIALTRAFLRHSPRTLGGGRSPLPNLPPGRSASRRTATGWAPCVRGELSGACASRRSSRVLQIARDVFERSAGLWSFAQSRVRHHRQKRDAVRAWSLDLGALCQGEPCDLRLGDWPEAGRAAPGPRARVGRRERGISAARTSPS